MSNDNTTPVVETANEVFVQDVPAVKTKKELKKERKEIKKHKKEVKKEAMMHSAKMAKFNRFLTTAISIFVIVAMIVCTFSAIKITKNINNGASVESGNSADSGSSGNSGSSSTPSNNPSSSDSSTPTGDSGNAPAGDSGAQSGSSVAGDLSTKEGVVEYYKTAHAKVLAEAKSVTRTYDNPTNYEEYLEVGGNSTLANVAKQLMGMFMKENTEALVYTGADIATNFPPSKNSCAGLTADMIKDFSCKEEGDNYIITLTLNSSKESPDLGDNAAHLVSIVDAKTVEDAAAGFVSFTGLRNEYIAPTITATINKATGQMTALETLTPSYMKFDKATVAFVVNVNNVGLGLQYEQKWTVEW